MWHDGHVIRILDISLGKSLGGVESFAKIPYVLRSGAHASCAPGWDSFISVKG